MTFDTQIIDQTHEIPRFYRDKVRYVRGTRFVSSEYEGVTPNGSYGTRSELLYGVLANTCCTLCSGTVPNMISSGTMRSRDGPDGSTII